MSALVPVIHSALTVFAVWEIGHDLDIQCDNDYARFEPLRSFKLNVTIE
jgi:hypothetical protein